MEPCRLRRGEHSGISSEDVATSEGSFGRTSEGHRPVELISSQPLDDFPRIIYAITAGVSRTNRLKQAIMVAGYKEMLCVRLIHTRCE